MKLDKKKLVYFCSLILISIFFIVSSISFVSAAWQYDTGWLDPFNYASQNQYSLCNNGNGGYCGAHQEGWTRCSDRSQNVYNPFWCTSNDCGSDKYREFMLRLTNVPSNFNDCKISILGDYDSSGNEIIRFTHSYNGNNAVRIVDIPDAGNGDPLEVVFPGTFSFQAGTNYLHFKHPEFCKQERGGSVHVRNFRVQCGEFFPPQNNPPTINIPDQTILEDSGINIAINDLNTVSNDPDGDILTFSVTYEDFFVDCEIVGNSLTLTPVFPDYFGISSCTIQADDGNGGIASSTFNITVLPVNDAPIIDGIPDINLDEDSGFNDNLIDLWFYSFDIETPVPLLTYTIISQTAPSIVDCIIDVFGFVDCDIQPNQVGFSDVVVEVSDPEGLSDTDTFRVNVLPLNDAPLWAVIPDANLSEDFGSILYILNLSAYITDPDNDTISFSISDENVSQVDCEILGNQLTLNSVANWNGNAFCTARADDGNGGVADNTFLITVNSVNDIPIVTIISPADSSSYTNGTSILFNGTATDVEDGVISGSNLVWFSSLQGIIGTGNSFTLSNLAIGTHLITLNATDSNNGIGSATITLIINSTGGGGGGGGGAEDEEEEEEEKAKEHEIIIKRITINEGINIVDCGSSLDVIVTIYNNGDFDEQNVYVTLKNSELGINKKSEIFDLLEGEQKDVKFTIYIPIDAKGDYTLTATVYPDGKTMSKKITVECEKGIIKLSGITAAAAGTQQGYNLLLILLGVFIVLLFLIILIVKKAKGI